MDIAAFARREQDVERREKELKLYAELLEVRRARLDGTAKYYTFDELKSQMRTTIEKYVFSFLLVSLFCPCFD